MVVAARSLPLPMEWQNAAQLTPSPWNHMEQTGLPVSLRIGGSLVGCAYYWLIHAVGNLMMIAPESQPLFIPPPADWPVKWWSRQDFFVHFATVASLYAARLTLLVPIVLLARRMLASPYAQTAYVVVVLVTLGGTPPMAVSAFFQAMRQVVDWPLGYYNFGHELLLADFAAIGFVNLLLLVLASPAGSNTTRVAILAAIGQLCFENLGFVTGVAAGLTALLSGQGRRQALRLFVAAGLASAPIMAVLVTLDLTMMTKVVEGGGSTLGYFSSKWLTVARQNFLWIKLVIAHLISLSVFPLLGGLILRLTQRQRPQYTWRNAALAVTAAVATSLVLGSLVSGFFPDFGRQMAFFLSLLPAFSLTLTRVSGR
ncbi:MAG: hypothetical protein AB7G62_08195 [Magnetospirillum sp.]